MTVINKTNLIFDTNILINYLEKKDDELISQKLFHFLQFGGSHNKIIFAGKDMINELNFNKENTSLLEWLIYASAYTDSPEIYIEDDNKKLDLRIEKFAKKEKLNSRGKDAGIIYISYKYCVKIIFTDDKRLKKKILSNKFSYLNKEWNPIIHNSSNILQDIKTNGIFYYYN